MRYFLATLLGLLSLGSALPTRADCQSDSGEVDDITDSGTAIVCNTEDPNPYLGGIGTTATSTNLSVTIEAGAEIVSSGVGVALVDGGSLDNSGDITATNTTVDGANRVNGEGITIDNTGSIRSSDGAAIVLGLPNSSITNSGTIRAATLGIQFSDSSLDNGGALVVTGNAATALDAGADSSINNSGDITSEAVAVSLGDTSTLNNSGTITSNGGVALITTGNAVITNTGTISGDGANAIELSGGNNQLTLGSGSDLQGNVVALPSGTASDRLILDESGSEADEFRGFASMVMQGSSWTLNGPLAAEQVFIESGTLTLNGSVTTAGNLQLNGGTLAGTGTINGTVNNLAGTVAAGDVAGQLTITGDYLQSSTASLRVSSSNTNIGRLQVNGSADLAGELIVSAGPDLIADILIADGGITGAFDNISVDGRALVAIVPTANSIQMVRVSTTLEDNMVEAGLDNSYLTLDTLASGIHTRPGSGIWLKAMASYGERDDVDGLPGGDYTIGGGGIGGDWQTGENFRIGGLFAYTSTDLDSDDGGDGSADNYNYGAFANYDRDTAWGAIWGTLAVAAGSSDLDQNRSILINNNRDKVSASYDASSYALRAIFGTRHAFLGSQAGTWLFEPSIGADYVVLDLDDYQEASGAALNYSIDDIESAQLFATLRVRHLLRDGDRFAPRFQLGVVHRMAIDDREWAATGTTGGNNLTLPGNDDDTTSLGAAAGFEFRASKRIYGYVDWLGEFSEDKRRHSLVLGVRINLGV
jgi:uncharacterized protein with beta-barrel porin domain